MAGREKLTKDRKFTRYYEQWEATRVRAATYREAEEYLDKLVAATASSENGHRPTINTRPTQRTILLLPIST